MDTGVGEEQTLLFKHLESLFKPRFTELHGIHLIRNIKEDMKVGSLQ